jgi:hypothetical protein
VTGFLRVLVFGFWLVPASAFGAASDCRLALVLALDVSSSVDAKEDALQRGGLASALVSTSVRQAFFASPLPVALAVYEWSGRYNQELLLDWTMIDRPEKLLQVADKIRHSKRSYSEFPTAIGFALGYGALLLERGPQCLFKTIDVSGDGENNEGFGPRQAYREFPFDGVTVNGLVVNAADFEAEVTLIDFYRSEILYGPGAFLEIADGFEDYERAITRKLVREVRPRTLSVLTPDAPPR